MGIPLTQSGDCSSIIKEICKKTNIELSMIETYRINSASSKQNIIVAILTALKMRKSFIRDAKLLKITADMISSNWPKESVFINEHLTKLKNMLLSQIMLASKGKQYKFVWLSNYDILVRINENENIIKVRSPENVKKL